jgi:hypothetical protein
MIKVHYDILAILQQNVPIKFTEILVTFFCRTPLVINVQVRVMALQILGRKQRRVRKKISQD